MQQATDRDLLTMTFKTQPHRYTIDLAPNSRARCRGCRRSIEKGALRLAIHAFVRPNRETTFTRHLSTECVGTAMAADVVGACSMPNGVRVDSGLEQGTVACAWEVLEAQAVERVSGCSGRRRGHLKDEVCCPRKPIVGTMLGYLRRVEVGGGEQKEDA